MIFDNWVEMLIQPFQNLFYELIAFIPILGNIFDYPHRLLIDKIGL